MQFFYRAKQDFKTEASGVVEAPDLSAAVTHLKQKGLYPLEVTPMEGETSLRLLGLKQKALSRSSLALWARTLSQGLSAGLSLMQSLHLLSEQEQGRPLGAIAKLLGESIVSGLSLAVAMEKMDSVFPVMAIRLVEAGEAGGALEEVLDSLADQMELEAELIAKIQGALFYPLFVLLVGVGTVGILLWVVIPKLAVLFVETGQPLPWATRLMIESGGVLFWCAAALGVLLPILYWTSRRMGITIPWMRWLMRFLNRLPLVGPLIVQSEFARLSAGLGLMLGHGLPLPESLRLVSGTLGSDRLQRQLQQSQQSVIEGMSLSAALKKSGIQEPFFMTMVGMGEAQGDLANTFNQAAERYRRDVDRSVKILSSLIEPVMILLVGLAVGAVVFSMLLPIFQINFAVE